MRFDASDKRGMTRPTRFDEISSNPAVVAGLAAAYASPDDVDFYVGLFAEDRVANSPLPELLLRMVAVDAFSQALTNPLLSEHVFNPATFSNYGWEQIQTTHSVRDLVLRNATLPAPDAFIGMARRDWAYVW